MDPATWFARCHRYKPWTVTPPHKGDNTVNLVEDARYPSHGPNATSFQGLIQKSLGSSPTAKPDYSWWT